LRDKDGIHMTPAGNQKFSNLVEKEILHDLALARRERDVPLAGDEAEQQNVRDASLPAGKGGATAVAKAAKSVKDVPADNGEIVLAAAEGGAPESLVIVRPALPGAVVEQAQTGRLPAPEPGQSMAADLMGGFTVLSSVTTSVTAKQSLTQQAPLTDNLFYKLLIRGDALQPKPGRVDDFSWPKAATAEAAETAPASVKPQQ
jgi:hypothetical protein